MNKQRNSEVFSLSAQILSGVIANPHIYSMVSDEGVSGKQERVSRHTALEIAERLIHDTENRENNS